MTRMAHLECRAYARYQRRTEARTRFYNAPRETLRLPTHWRFIPSKAYHVYERLTHLADEAALLWLRFLPRESEGAA